MEALLLLSGAGFLKLLSDRKKRVQQRRRLQRERRRTVAARRRAQREAKKLVSQSMPRDTSPWVQYPQATRVQPMQQYLPAITPMAHHQNRVNPDQSYNTAGYPDHLPTLQSVYAPIDTEPTLAHPGVQGGYRVPNTERAHARLFQPQYNAFTPHDEAQRMNPNNSDVDIHTVTPHHNHTPATRRLGQRGPFDTGFGDDSFFTSLEDNNTSSPPPPQNYFDGVFGDPNTVDPYSANPLRYEDGLTPSFGSNTGNVLRRETLPPHLHKPAKREVLQNVMRAPPQPQRDVFGAPIIHHEQHQRARENNKFTSGNGALDTYTPYEGNQQVGFGNGQYITPREGGFHPRRRFYPSTEYKKGLQLYGRLGNPSDAIGKLGSTFAQGVGPLGAHRMPRNVHVSEYEREAMPTGAPGRNPVGCRIGNVILRPTYRSETNRAHMGHANASERNQPSLRLKGRYVKGKNSVSREEVGFVGANDMNRGAYATSSVQLYNTNRQTTSRPSELSQIPGLATGSMRGAYSTSSVHLQGQNRDSTSVGSEHVQTPGLATGSMRGAYSTSEVELYDTNRVSTSVGSEHAQVPGLATDSMRGAYSTSSVHLQGQNRDSTTVGSEHKQHCYFPNKGTNPGYNALYLDRYTQKADNIHSRPANPVLAQNRNADIFMKSRINNHDDMRYTQKCELNAILQAPLRAPNSDRTGAMQYQLDYPTPKTRRVSPTIVNRIDSGLLDAYNDCPYTQPLTAI